MWDGDNFDPFKTLLTFSSPQILLWYSEILTHPNSCSLEICMIFRSFDIDFNESESSFIYLSPLAPRTPWQWLLSLADGWLAQLVTVQLAILHFGFIIPTIWEWFLHVFTQQKWPFLPSKSGNGSYLDLPDCNWMFVWIMRDSPVDRSYNQYLRCTSK